MITRRDLFNAILLHSIMNNQTFSPEKVMNPDTENDDTKRQQLIEIMIDTDKYIADTQLLKEYEKEVSESMRNAKSGNKYDNRNVIKCSTEYSDIQKRVAPGNIAIEMRARSDKITEEIRNRNIDFKKLSS